MNTYHTVSNSATEPTLHCRNGGRLTNLGGPVDKIMSFKYEGFAFVKGGIMSEVIGRFLPLPKNIPINYLKLSYPVHGNDKIFVQFNRLHVKKDYS